jgi:hypothetical protein
MKYTLSDKIIAYLTLFSGLTISAVAIYYSVAGLTAIFAAAVIPIIVMGVALEISKLAATVWLKQNWQRAPNFIRAYLLIAILILMLITSMGIFGFLSKAHSDQSLVSGDVQSKIAVYDEKIKTSKDNIEANRKALRQMDEAVDQVMGRSSDEKGADKAVQLRRSQQKERARLQSEIAAEQKTIAAINEERAPIAAEVRKVEAEVGPIKYIANFIYGNDPDANILEKAVTWVIVIIVIVFDPLAVILLLASQYSFQWFRRQEEEENEKPKSINDIVPQPQTLIVDEPEMASDLVELEKVQDKTEQDLVEEANAKLAEIESEVDIDATIASAEEVKRQEEKSALEEWNAMIAEAEKAAEEEKEKDDHEILETAADTEKKAMKAWKHDNPEGSLKLQKKLLAKGVIDQLPWEKYLEASPDFTDEENEAAIEAAKWAAEQLDPKKKDSDMDRARGQGTDTEVQGDLGYVQNAEQNDGTLWKRVKAAKKDL